MRVLAFDPAASCGWCVLDGGTYVDGGTEVFRAPTIKELKAGAHPQRKWLHAHEWLVQTVRGFNPDLVFCEDVHRHAGTTAAHHYGFYRLTIEAACAGNGVEFHPIGVNVWKSLIGVSGSADKDIVLDEVQRRFTGVDFLTHDHSDACGIAVAGHLLASEDRLAELISARKRK